MDTTEYPAVLTQTPAGYQVTFPDFPEATVVCGSEPEVAPLARQCLSAAVRFRRERGRGVPIPSKIRPGHYRVPLHLSNPTRPDGQGRGVR